MSSNWQTRARARSSEKLQPRALADAREQPREVAARRGRGGQCPLPRAGAPVLGAAGERGAQRTAHVEAAWMRLTGPAAPASRRTQPLGSPSPRPAGRGRSQLRSPTASSWPRSLCALPRRTRPPAFPAPRLKIRLRKDARRGSPCGRPRPPPGASLTSDADARQRPQHQ